MCVRRVDGISPGGLVGSRKIQSISSRDASVRIISIVIVRLRIYVLLVVTSNTIISATLAGVYHQKSRAKVLSGLSLVLRARPQRPRSTAIALVEQFRCSATALSGTGSALPGMFLANRLRNPQLRSYTEPR